MVGKTVLSANKVADLLAKIFGPSIFDTPPPFNGGDPFRRNGIGLIAGIHPEPKRASELNPQPLPPRESQALMLADAHIQDLLTLDRIGTVFGAEPLERTVGLGLKTIADMDELCSRWPHWPKVWPPPPPWQQEEMTPTELFVFGARLLASAELFEQGKLQNALAGLGDRKSVV